MSLIPMERVATQTLLGIRFWDRLTASAVSDGLRVKAQRLSNDRSQRLGRAVFGRVAPSGVIAFFGISSDELVDDDPSLQIPETMPTSRFVAIDFADTRERFLPMSFVAQLPFIGPFRGRGGWLSTTLLRPIPNQGGEMGVQVWSHPSRRLPHGFGKIRAQIVVGNDVDAPPASYALVRATHLVNGVPSNAFRHFGLADERGMLSLPLPYPPVPQPASGPYPSLDSQEFDLRITVRGGMAALPTLPERDLPNLEFILNQPLANIVRRLNRDDLPASDIGSTLDVRLRLGRPLTLRTMLAGAVADQPDSVLRIQPF